MVGLKIIDKRRLEELKEEIGVRESLTKQNGRGTIDEESGCAWSGG